MRDVTTKTWSSWAIALAIVGFVALLAASMAVYPGGHSWDPHAVGHDFWRNFLCDLDRHTALDGTPNPLGAALGRAAMLVLAAGLLPFFGRLAALAPNARRLGLAMRVAATVAVAAVPAVVFVSGDRYGRLHAVAVVVAGVPGLLACGLAVLALLLDRSAPRRVAWTGAAALAVGVVDFALYAASLSEPGSGHVVVAVLERLANLGLLAWMALAAGSTLRSPPEASASVRPGHVCARSPAAVGLDAGREAA